MKCRIVKDCKGKAITAGDKVIYWIVEETLLNGLPYEDQIAINDQKYKSHIVVDIDDRGFLEIDFEHTRPNSEIIYHTIWVPPYCFELAPSKTGR
jgi:hypothetical protein